MGQCKLASKVGGGKTVQNYLAIYSISGDASNVYQEYIDFVGNTRRAESSYSDWGIEFFSFSYNYTTGITLKFKKAVKILEIPKTGLSVEKTYNSGATVNYPTSTFVDHGIQLIFEA